MVRSLQSLAPWTVVLVGLTLAGCSGKYEKYEESGATLDGTVTYGKDQIQVALVIAQGANGSAQGFIDDDGHYHLTNVPLGQVNIGVNTQAGKGQLTSKLMAQRGGTARTPKVIDVPDKFANPGTSGIKTNIEKGENKFDVVIPK
jgi:hypothetical protein